MILSLIANGHTVKTVVCKDDEDATHEFCKAVRTYGREATQVEIVEGFAELSRTEEVCLRKAETSELVRACYGLR